jgi:hypothetical protein
MDGGKKVPLRRQLIAQELKRSKQAFAQFDALISSSYLEGSQRDVEWDWDDDDDAQV